ncbi:MAG: N-6 DNA methylase, partial [Bryobacterales bacterium]|nr:N-6 DNA methylase [Bryobacterales bacterium]
MVEPDEEFGALLPYILEQHGPGSRASVMRDSSTAPAREAKRRTGVFYTPSDVATYLAESGFQSLPNWTVDDRCLDPACGSGAILLAACRVAARRSGVNFDWFEYITQSLYGCDINSHALDAAAFVLLSAAIQDVFRRNLTPWAAWHRIRMNLVQVDSVTLHYSRKPRDGSALKLRAELSAALSRPGVDWQAQVKIGAFAPSDRHGLFHFECEVSLLEIGVVFPEAANGFDVLLANPPYATLAVPGERNALRQEYKSLATCGSGPRTSVFPLFIEMSWRLTNPQRSTAAIVTPLSIAYSSTAQLRDCRDAMSSAGGTWRFAFFDREPHALFGEEVKTRNCIMLRACDEKSQDSTRRAHVFTGPLQRWTSRTRHSLFQRIEFTDVGRIDIKAGIPKFDGSVQAKAYCTLNGLAAELGCWAANIFPADLSAVFRSEVAHRVFVGGTAYNFLNVYRQTSDTGAIAVPLTESPVHCLEFNTEEEADIAFAILQSRITFWLWHSTGDGFHVTSTFLRELPFALEMFDSRDQIKLRG